MNAMRVWRDSGVRQADTGALHGPHHAACGRLCLLACLVVSAVGCRTGSWTTKPSWMTFGQKTTDPDRLSSAPAFAGDVPKPSATAKPYPTTSTPEAYSLPDAGAQAATAPGGVPAAVTYGSTPPPAELAKAAPPPQAATTAPIAAQVGPYAASAGALPPETTAAASNPASGWTSAAPAAAGPPLVPTDPSPATVSTAPPPWATASAAMEPPASPAAPASVSPPASPAPPQRFADARASSPAWTPAPLDPSATAGRYAGSGTSRFSTGEMTTAAASMLPAPPPAPATLPAPPTELQPTVPPMSPPAAAPAAPVRRPDPGYRPGGTSSYQPARSSLAGEPASAVQPAGFEADSGAAF